MTWSAPSGVDEGAPSRGENVLRHNGEEIRVCWGTSTSLDQTTVEDVARGTLSRILRFDPTADKAATVESRAREKTPVVGPDHARTAPH